MQRGDAAKATKYGTSRDVCTASIAKGRCQVCLRHVLLSIAHSLLLGCFADIHPCIYSTSCCTKWRALCRVDTICWYEIVCLVRGEIVNRAV